MKLRWKWCLLATALASAVCAVSWFATLLLGPPGFFTAFFIILAAGIGYGAGRDTEGREG